MLTVRDIQVLSWWDEDGDRCVECAQKKWDLVRLAKCEQGLCDYPRPYSRYDHETDATENGWHRAEARVARGLVEHPMFADVIGGEQFSETFWQRNRLTQRLAYKIGKDEQCCWICGKNLLALPEVAA